MKRRKFLVQCRSHMHELVAELLRPRAGESSPERSPESMELGLTRGPLITWAKDDELPVAALTRIRDSWGKLWQELYPP